MSQLLKEAVMGKYPGSERFFNATYTDDAVDELDLAIRHCQRACVGLEIEDAIDVVEASFEDEWDATIPQWIEVDTLLEKLGDS